MPGSSTMVQRLILQAGIDAQKAREAMTGLAGLNREVERTAVGFRRFANAATNTPQAMRPTLEALAKLKTRARSALEEVQDLREELLRTDAVDITIKAQQQQKSSLRAAGPGGAFLSAIGGVTGTGTLADAGRILTSVNNIRALGEQVQDLGLKARGVITAGGLSVVALAAMTAAIDSFTQQTQKAASQLSGAITGATDAIRIVATGTREDVQKAIDDARQNLAILQQQRDVNQRVIDQWARSFGIAAGAIEALVPAAGPIREARDAVTEFDKQIAQNETSITVLTDALDANATAAQDAAAATRRLNEQYISDAEKGIAAFVEQQRRIRTWTTDQTAARIQEIDDEIAVTRASWSDLRLQLAAGSEEAEAARVAFENRIASLVREKRSLEELVAPAARAREAAESAKKAEEELAATREKLVADLARTTEQLANAESAERKRQADVARQAERDSIVKGFEARIDAAQAAEDAAEQERDLADARVEATAALADLDAEYMADSIKALQDYLLEAARLQEDHYTAIRRMGEDLVTDLTDLAAQRDVAGFVRRRRQGETDISRASEDFGTDARRRAEDFARANAERQAQYAQERAERQRQAQERIAQIRAEGQAIQTESERLQEELAALRARWADEDRQRENDERARAAAEQIAALRAHQGQVVRELAGSYNTQYQQVKTFAQGVANLWNQMIQQAKNQQLTMAASTIAAQVAQAVQTANQVASNIGRALTGSRAVTVPMAVGSYGGGGRRYHSGVSYVPEDGWAYLQRGEEVRSAAAARSGGGRNAQITFVDQRTIQVGDIASRRMVEDAIAKDRGEMLAGLQMAVWGGY
jgi:hypothetical protein